MISINQTVTDLHHAYCSAMGLDLPMNACYERWWLASGLTPEQVEICIASRLKFNRAHPGHGKGLELKHLIRSDEDVAVVINEVAVVLSERRVRVMEPARASVLRATGRSDAVAQPDAVHVGEYIEKMRNAANER